jgi:hypothetical protein
MGETELYSLLIFLIALNLLLFSCMVIYFIVKNKADNKCMGTIKVERLESGARTWAFSFNEGVDYDIIENMDTVRFKVDLKKEENNDHT